MDTLFMKSENSNTSEYHVLVLKLTDKLDLRRGQKNVSIDLKYLLRRGMKNLSYRMDHIQYQIFKIVLNIFQRNTLKMLIIHQL